MVGSESVYKVEFKDYAVNTHYAIISQSTNITSILMHLKIYISSRKGILRYEAIFGRTWVSVGGETTTR